MGSVSVTGFTFNRGTFAFGGWRKSNSLSQNLNLPSVQLRSNQKVSNTQLFFSSNLIFPQFQRVFISLRKENSKKEFRIRLIFLAFTRHISILGGQPLNAGRTCVFFQCFPHQNVGNGKTHSSCYWCLGVLSPLRPLSLSPLRPLSLSPLRPLRPLSLSPLRALRINYPKCSKSFT